MKIKTWVKRFFRGWVPVEPLKSKHWLRNRIRLLGLSVIVASVITVGIFSLFTSPLTAIPPPIFTGEYAPGVSVGEYVVYGNFVCNREHREGTTCIKDLAFKKMEVIAVSGKEVTFLYTEQFKNGSETMRNGLTSTWDVEKFAWGAEDDELWIDFDQIIAANLTGGSCILNCSETGYAEWSKDNSLETEVRTYLGVDRTVVVYSFRHKADIDGIYMWVKDNTVYDQLSGIRLEVERLAWDGTGYNDLLQSFSVVETNIFSNPNSSLSSFQNTMAKIPTVVIYVVAGLIIIATFVGVGIFLRRKRSKGGECVNGL
jgi:hypothetical protein